MDFAETYLGKLRQVVGSRLLMVGGGRAVLENSDGKILLHKRSDFDVWAFPIGGAEEGESAEQCIIREVLEETELKIIDYEAIGFASDPRFETVAYPNGDITQNFCLILYSGTWTGELSCENEETNDLRFFELSELPLMPENEKRTAEKYVEWKKTNKFQLY
jgi:ADP-ribose pyrophosphatase YjhB (NUDIX family)